MGKHARLSPSNKRWPNCPGSIREEAAYEDVSGEAAIDGTGSHFLLERCLYEKKHAVGFLGSTIAVGEDDDKPEGWLVEQDRCDRVQIAIDYFGRRYLEIKVDSFESESTCSPGHYLCDRDDWWGTVDVTIRGILKSTGRKIMDITDYKDGFQYVDVKDNSQMIGYAAGKIAPFVYDAATKSIDWEALKDWDVRMCIIQPKNEWDPIRHVDMTGTELFKLAMELCVAAAATDDPDATLVCGEWCKWCKHSTNCPERVAAGINGMSMVASGPLFETIKEKSIVIADMDNSQLAAILDAEAIVTSLFDNIREEAFTRCKQGQEVPGYINGPGKGKKVWTETQEITEQKLKGMRFLKDEIHPRKFLTPAQALKKSDLTERQAKKLETELIKYVAGDEKLIRSNLKRISAEQMFADLPELPSTKAEQPVTETKEDLSTLTFL